jgi:hypothetical protein
MPEGDMKGREKPNRDQPRHQTVQTAANRTNNGKAAKRDQIAKLDE